MKVPLYHPKRVRVEMIPLIDIVFLLLVFFIYAMLSMAVHHGLPVLLPSSESASVEKRLTLSVTLQAGGALFLNEEPATLEDLAPALAEKTRNDPDAGVLLFADRTIPYQDLFEVLDRIREAGITRVSLQAEAEKAL